MKGFLKLVLIGLLIIFIPYFIFKGLSGDKDKFDKEFLQCANWAIEMTTEAIKSGASYRKAGEIENAYMNVCLEDTKLYSYGMNEKDKEQRRRNNIERLNRVLLEAKIYRNIEKAMSFNDNQVQYAPEPTIPVKETSKYVIEPICRLNDEGDKSLPLCDSK